MRRVEVTKLTFKRDGRIMRGGEEVGTWKRSQRSITVLMPGFHIWSFGSKRHAKAAAREALEK